MELQLLLKYDLVEPVAMELFVIDIDGQNMRQITSLGGASWAPYYLNDNKRVIFRLVKIYKRDQKSFQFELQRR